MVYIQYKIYKDVPLSSEKDTEYSNYFEMQVFDKAKKVIYSNSFVTNHDINQYNIHEIARIGRKRWKIENEAFNVLKNNGYNLEHNFGHGKENLANVLACFNLIAFLVHNLSSMLCEVFDKVRSCFGAKVRFFQHLAMLLSIQVFDSWWHIITFMEECFAQPPPKKSK